MTTTIPASSIQDVIGRGGLAHVAKREDAPNSALVGAISVGIDEVNFEGIGATS